MTPAERKASIKRIRSSFMWQPSKYGSCEGAADIHFLLSEIDQRDEALRKAVRAVEILTTWTRLALIDDKEGEANVMEACTLADEAREALGGE